MKYTITPLLFFVLGLLFASCTPKTTEQVVAPDEETEINVEQASSQLLDVAQEQIDILKQYTDLSTDQEDKINSIYEKYASQFNSSQADELRKIQSEINQQIRNEVLTPEQIEQVRSGRNGNGGG